MNTHKKTPTQLEQGSVQYNVVKQSNALVT